MYDKRLMSVDEDLNRLRKVNTQLQRQVNMLEAKVTSERNKAERYYEELQKLKSADGCKNCKFMAICATYKLNVPQNENFNIKCNYWEKR